MCRSVVPSLLGTVTVAYFLKVSPKMWNRMLCDFLLINPDILLKMWCKTVKSREMFFLTSTLRWCVLYELMKDTQHTAATLGYSVKNGLTSHDKFYRLYSLTKHFMITWTDYSIIVFYWFSCFDVKLWKCMCSCASIWNTHSTSRQCMLLII